MKPENFPNNSCDYSLINSTSLINDVEVHIILSQEGAPYCEFVPSWKLMQSNPFYLADRNQPSGYAMSDCGYPESYPMFSGEEA